MIAAAMAPQNQMLDLLPPVCKKFIRFYIFVAPGPSEGWRGQDQGRLRSASGGHAERLPHVGRIGNHVLQAFFFSLSSLSPPLRNHIPPLRITPKPTCSPLCSLFFVSECVSVRVLMWRGKRKMYCIHYYLLPHIGVLWILCMITDRACMCVDSVCVCVYERKSF